MPSPTATPQPGPPRTQGPLSPRLPGQHTPGRHRPAGEGRGHLSPSPRAPCPCNLHTRVLRPGKTQTRKFSHVHSITRVCTRAVTRVYSRHALVCTASQTRTHKGTHVLTHAQTTHVRVHSITCMHTHAHTHTLVPDASQGWKLRDPLLTASSATAQGQSSPHRGGAAGRGPRDPGPLGSPAGRRQGRQVEGSPSPAAGAAEPSRGPAPLQPRPGCGQDPAPWKRKPKSALICSPLDPSPVTREAAPRRLQSPGRPTGASGPQRELREVTATSAWGHSGSLTTSYSGSLPTDPGTPLEQRPRPPPTQLGAKAHTGGTSMGHPRQLSQVILPPQTPAGAATPTPPGATQPRDSPGGPQTQHPLGSPRGPDTGPPGRGGALTCMDRTLPGLPGPQGSMWPLDGKISAPA